MPRLWHIATFYVRNASGFRRVELAAAAERLAMLALEPPRQVEVLLVWTEPRAVVSEAISTSRDPFEALAVWTDETRLHLAMARQSGRSCLVLARRVLEGPRRVGLENDLPILEPSIAPDPLVALLADAILRRDAEASNLLARLGAEEQGKNDLHACLAALFELQARASTGNALLLSKLQVEQTKAHLETFHNDAEARRSELDRIYTSRSWRLTEPLRALRRLIDRLL